MNDRRTRTTGPARRLRWSVPVGLLVALPLAQAVSAGVTGGDAIVQAADITLISTEPAISLIDETELLEISPGIGNQTVNGSLDVTSGDSSFVAATTSIVVSRTDAAVGASAAIGEFTLTLLGETVASATSVMSFADCPAATSSAVLAEAQTTGLALGDAAPVDLSAGQSSSGSITIDGPDGATTIVDLTADAIGDVVGTEFADATGLRLTVLIDGVELGAVTLATARCERPQDTPGPMTPGPVTPGPVTPGGGLADSGTDTAAVAAVLGMVLVAGGGSALAWARSGRSRRSDPR